MDGFEEMLAAEQGSVERFVRFRLQRKADADDCLQEIYLTAYRNFGQLRDKSAFKAWILAIARNKCNDYFRRMAGQLEIPIDALTEKELICGRHGITQIDTVRNTLERLGDKDKQILYLYFWKELPQAEIARMLHIPLGTVKSRLYTAKQNFKNKYPHRMEATKGDSDMKRLPEYLPEYKIKESNEAPFTVKFEELMGWHIIPKLGEKLSWGIYDMPSRKGDYFYEMAVTGKALIHGIEGVELTAREVPFSRRREGSQYTFVAQLTDTHCRYLAVIRNDGGVRNYTTFLDGDAFLTAWGYGENNCGNETDLCPKGEIKREGQAITCEKKDFLLDIVGRYTVTIGGKSYDTLCLIDISAYDSGGILEQFLDRNGRTILSRRFNRDDWAMERYGKRWTELLPENERLTVNGETYVHWYDCITDYIL